MDMQSFGPPTTLPVLGYLAFLMLMDRRWAWLSFLMLISLNTLVFNRWIQPDIGNQTEARMQYLIGSASYIAFLIPSFLAYRAGHPRKFIILVLNVSITCIAAMALPPDLLFMVFLLPNLFPVVLVWAALYLWLIVFFGTRKMTN